MIDNSVESFLSILLEVKTYDKFFPTEIIEHLSKLIDTSYDLERLDGIEKAINHIESIDINKFNSEQKSILYYCMGNAWANKVALIHPNKNDKYRWNWQQAEYERVIYYYRMSIKEPDFINLSNFIKCNIYTNLANTFDTIGRFIEAIEYWQKTIELDSTFGMALGNLGIGLISYGSHLYDYGHKRIFINKACDYLKSGIKNLPVNDYSAPVIKDFQKHIAQIDTSDEKISKCKYLERIYPLGRSKNEREYRRWCLKHRLFLNPLNDLGEYSIAAQDIISVPNIITPLNIGPKYQGFYNQMKQEFVSARYLFYEGTRNKNTHFSDRDVLLINTLDYPCYCIAIEKVKMAFCTAYSIFDKVAFYINDYFNLNENQRNIYFRTIWLNKSEIRLNFKNKKNLPLRGLFWLSKDIFIYSSDLEENIRDSVEPDAEDLYEIRNHLEHKYLKVHDILIENKTIGLSDNLAFSIQRDEFEKKTLKLLKLVRNTLIYLTLSIHSEELERNKNKKGNEIYIPVINQIWDDKWKR